MLMLSQILDKIALRLTGVVLATRKQNVCVIYFDYGRMLSNYLWRDVKPISHTKCVYFLDKKDFRYGDY